MQRGSSGMSEENRDQSPESAEAAMNRVLAAEQDAARAIEQCEREADAILQDARQRARRIASRTDERIALINQRIRQRLQKQLAEAERQARRSEQEDADDSRTARLDEVVAGLAARLTGGADGD